MNLSSTTTTTTAAPLTTKTYELTARQRRNEVLAQRDRLNLSMVPVVGNAYPLKGALWTLGSMWDAERKILTVPTNTYKEAQGIIDAYNVAHPPKSKAAKVEPVQTEAKPVEAAPVETAPAAKAPAPAAPKAASKPTTIKPVKPSILLDRINVLQRFIDGATKSLAEAGAAEAAERMANVTACLELVKEALPA